MGRPKLYKTTKELREAKRMHRQAYYARNKNTISTKMKARYRAQASASSTINSDQSFPDQKHAREKNRLLTYLGASPRKTLDAMYTDFLETHCSDNICDVMGIVQEILRELKEIKEDIARARVTGRSLLYLYVSMAPHKWTTSEQEVWLELWYQMFSEKQSNKSRNHKNFFADLFEKWFEAFPEPRPTHIIEPGPLTLEEHNEAIDKRKAISVVDIKLHTRFKNNFSGSKVGRQAKANASDVFDAVVRKITECEKPTRMLQEHEAYSKLYYADRVQKSIQETLKVAQATQSLTNGQRVALVKKETAALYAGESEEIKAKVKEYIHAQKEEHGKEKAEPWSDEDQQRNLTKLATVANQFLKGLADATGLSFSLLVGGPSVELGGLIDVWSFHVGTMKLGNNLSQAYPKFESEIAGPFRDYLYCVYPEAAVLKAQKMGGASSSSSSWGDGFGDENQSSSDMMNNLSKRDVSLSGTFGFLDLSEFPSLGSPTFPTPMSPFSSDNVLSGDNQPSWLSDSLDDFLETLAQNMPIGFANPTAHLPGSAEEPNSDRPDPFSASSMGEDPTEDSCLPSTPSHTSASANVVNEAQLDAHPPSTPSHASASVENEAQLDVRPPSTPSHTSASADVVNEAQLDVVPTDNGNDSNGPRRTRRAHIPSTRNIIANSIGNNCKENMLSTVASKCNDPDSSAHVGQQAK
ncbi:uncharacterized protein EDB91DRAFT_1084917 [Suillus paluster]|uniref:uncharacterized protein n=1 Tax=Suillus paluster TaxID=48578 RepID=UPI001B884C9D|nr:uncharacterized protein EDB91DRAFT_1084917 [Suillus paluster]KAG1731825.1 hypothetical protein EDB91DRAFT_1084917 [Suillus paluster]